MQAPAALSKTALLREFPDTTLRTLIDHLSENLRMRNRETFRENLTQLVEKIVEKSVPILSRAFLKWTGNREIKNIQEAIPFVMARFEHLQTEHIEGLKIRLLAPMLVASGHGRRIFHINTGEKSISEYLKKHLSHLDGFQEDCLRRLFRKSFKKLILAEGAIRKIEDVKTSLADNRAAQENLSRIQSDLRFWALQYQFKTAKIPIMEQKVELHLPFLDYLNDNVARYYRGDGGALAELFLNFVRQSRFPCLAAGAETIKALDKVGIIAYSKFSELLRVVSQKPLKDHRCGFISINDLSKWPADMPDYTVVDVSRILAVPLQNEKLQLVCRQIQEKVKASPEHVLVGGALDLGNNIGIYILFCHSKDTGSWLKEMETYQGAIGGYPEVSLLRRTLVNTPFPLDQLIAQYPFRDTLFDNDVHSWMDCPPQEIGLDEIHNRLHDLQATDLSQLDALLHPTKMTQIYRQIVRNFLAEMETYMVADPLLSLLPAAASIRKLKKRLQLVIHLEKSTPPAHILFQKVSQQYSLMMEEILFLFIYLKPSSLSLKLEHAANVLPFVPPDASPMKKRSWFASSGMASYVSIFKACSECYAASSKPPKVVLLQGCYFEVADEGMLRDYLSKTFDFQLVSLEDCGKQRDCDIVCLDLYPNYAPLRTVQVTPVVKIVQDILSESGPRRPLTLLLDTSTTIFWASEVISIIAELAPLTEKGRLNLVLVSSLAKYAMCGWDRTPGGLSQLYYQMHSAMQSFDAAFSQEFLSPEGTVLASIFLLKNRPQIDHYIKTIFENTDYVYEMLKPLLQNEKACLLLGERESPIPILAFHFDQFLERCKIERKKEFLSNCTYLVFYYMAEKAQALQLPLLIRPSFGFPHAALTECHTALRCTLGIEDKPILEDYVQFFQKINDELETFTSHPSKEFRRLMEEEEIKYLIEEHHTQVVSRMHGVSFGDFFALLHQLKTN